MRKYVFYPLQPTYNLRCKLLFILSKKKTYREKDEIILSFLYSTLTLTHSQLYI